MSLKPRSALVLAAVVAAGMLACAPASLAVHATPHEAEGRAQALTSTAPTQAGTVAPTRSTSRAYPAAVGPPRTVAGSTGQWSARPATYGTVIERDVPITMSDGVVLRADVIRPARDGRPAPGRFPVVLTQTPYTKADPAIPAAETYLVQRGYVQVITDVRGTGGSQGTWDSFGTREQRDGAEIVEWTASPQRSWSDGKVATFGASYMAINQLFTAAQHPRGLKAAFPIVPADDIYRDVVASGGQVDAGFIPLWLGLVTATGVLPPTSTGADPVMASGVMAAHLGGAGAFQLPTLMSSLTGGDLAYDGPFYRLRSPASVLDQVRVPTFVVGGWYDIFQRGEPLVYEQLRRNGVPTRLLMGPWTHVQAATGTPSQLPAPGFPSVDAAALRWFDHYVRGVPDPWLDGDIAPVTYWKLGTGGWATAPSWMPSSVHARTLQLAGAVTGPATGTNPGRLTSATASGAADPIAPVAISGLCSRSSSQWTAGIVPQTPCATDDRVDDATGPAYDVRLTKPLSLFGPVALRAFVSTTGRDALVAARLEDVAPDGTVTQLTAGWQVLSLRALDRARSRVVDGQLLQPFHPFTRASVLPVMPGAVYEADVELFPTGAVLAAGHTLRIALHAFDTPHLVAPVPQLTDSTGVLSIHHDARYPSQLVLPVRQG